jgi:hypothetical protein
MTRRDDLMRLRDAVALRAFKAKSAIKDAAKSADQSNHHRMIIFATRMDEAEAILFEIDALIAQEDAAPMAPLSQRPEHEI